MISLKEALINNSNVGNIKIPDRRINLEDPKFWNIGDFIYITYNYNACLPVFYKIINKTGKGTFYIQEYERTLVKGFYNSPSGYEVVPNEQKPRSNETKRVRISNEVIKIDRHIAQKWNGEPVHGYSD